MFAVLIILVLLLSSIVDFSTIQPVKAAQNFSDNFDDGITDGWTQQLGTWSAANGEYRVSVGIIENGISTVNGLSFGDCVIQTQLSFTDSVGFRAGIVFRYADNQHYYALEISNEYNKIDLIRYSPADPGYGDVIAENVISINSNINYQFRLEAAGSNFNAYLNGQKVLSGTDNAYTSGVVGLRARRADVSFDNFAASGDVQSIPATPTPAPTIPPQHFPGAFSDDFSTNTGAWQYLGTAYRDSTNQYLILTPSGNEQAGVAFFNTPINGAFTANFRFKAGGGNCHGDGFTMFFYKQKYSTVDSDDSGSRLGFNSASIIPGYGIEFDGWQNIAWDFQSVAGTQQNPQGDPSSNHVALIQDYTGNHLTYVNDARVADTNWHSVTVNVQASSVSVSIDQTAVLQWSGTIDRTYDGFGFSGSNGGTANDWHIIDDFSISAQNLKTPVLTTSCVSSASQSSFNVYKINGDLTFNGEGLSGAPILLSYSATGGQSWQDLTLVYTRSDGSYTALWMPTATGSYLLKTAFKGNENYLGANDTISFAIQPVTEQSVFSLTSNSSITELTFNSPSKELSFSVSGDSGTTGYVNVYIPKSLLNDTSDLKVSLDGNQMEYTSQSQGDCWLLYFTYHHSTHSIVVSFDSLNLKSSLAPTKSTTQTPEEGLGWVEIAILVFTGIIAVSVVVAAFVRLTKKRPQ
jgi:hypothetical protein